MGWPLDKPRQEVFEDWAIFDAYRSYGPHEGLDFSARVGDGVLSCLDGTVRTIGDRGDKGYGKFVVIDHADGWVTWYAHLSSVSCKVGDTVTKGQRIAAAGNTGNSTGSHLHLSVQHIGHGRGGYFLADVVDPQKYL